MNFKHKKEKGKKKEQLISLLILNLFTSFIFVFSQKLTITAAVVLTQIKDLNMT